MSVLALLFAAVIMHVFVHVYAESSSLGFISIDCGTTSGSSYTDKLTNITYISDDGYIHTGENHNISSEYQAPEQSMSILNVRSFPNGGRNCYTLSSAKKGQKYLVRATFMYGNYDGKNLSLMSSPLIFDIYMGLDFWDRITITNATFTYVSEVIVVAVVNTISVCLMDNGKGTPFISSLEMRPMKSSIYPAAMANQSLGLYERRSMGASPLFRYPDDHYDRIWRLPTDSSKWIKLTTAENVEHYPSDSFDVQSIVLQTAITTSSKSVPINFSWIGRPYMDKAPAYFLNLYFAEFQRQRVREIDVYYEDKLWDTYKIPYLLAGYTCSTARSTSDTGFYNVSIVATNSSELPPMLNAYEVYYLIQRSDTTTAPDDVDAMFAIKTEYQVMKNWMGDPCLPDNNKWIGLNCSSDGDTSRVIYLDLSHSDLQGAISDQFSMLRSLQYLNLSHNGLNGSVPDSLTNLSSLFVLDLSGNYFDGKIPETLCTKKSLTLRYDTINEDPCNGDLSKKKNTVVLAIAIVVPVVMVVMLVSAMLMFCFRKKQGTTASVHLEGLGVPNFTRQDCKDHVHLSNNREFTYEELAKITNNFSVCIGEGGFGPVFHGQLNDGTQVAVKMHSQTSALQKGIAQFLAEVGSLTTVHHRYLVLLVGYCSNKDHLALIYEYMLNGSLYDHLRGKNAIVQTLSWQVRARIALEAAQGLDYLHTGCVLPIIHRDVKSHNILLGHDMVAKISDFGLSKSCLNVTQSYISASAAGTVGYIDPGYYLSGRLTMSSDVFSFGVVLLEILTGEPPILPISGHIVQRVKEKVSMGKIDTIVDPRLHGNYDISSIWKVVDIALLCTREASVHRPTMNTVVVQLKDALALEEARAIDIVSYISQGCTNAELSSNSLPSAR